MPFSTLSQFEQARETEQRERNPRHVAAKGGDRSMGEEKHSQNRVEEGIAHRKSRYNVEGRGEAERKANAE